jgi:hypothetical protein
MLERSVAGVNRFRDANPDKKVVDIHYADLARDPIGAHPSEYGLDAGEIAERFRPYVERYGIPLETGGGA